MAIVFTCFPLLVNRLSRKTESDSSKQVELSNANVIKQRISELESEVNQGLIDAAEKDNAIRDLKLALVEEMPLPNESTNTSNNFLLIALGLPAVLIGIWVYWQSNQLAGLKAFQNSSLEVADLRKKLEEQGPQSLTPNDYAKFALSIRSSLRDNPDDARGWSFLAMVNTSIGRVEEGIAAYNKALDLTPSDDALRFKYAEALMLQGTEESLHNASRQLSYLTQKEPENRNNRLLLTSVAIQLQNVELAVEQFMLIRQDLNPTSNFYKTIVAELRKLGVTEKNIVGDGVNELQQVGVSEELVNKNGTTAMVINVNLSEELKSKLPENAYLIVFAQHSDLRSRAPLAVKRIRLPLLPMQITLSDSDAMIATMNLSSANSVRVTARISLDENVMPTKGELEGSVSNIEIAKVTDAIDVVINKVVD